MSRPFFDGSDNLFGWERVIDDCQLKGNLYPDTDKLICMCTNVTYSRAQPPVTTDYTTEHEYMNVSFYHPMFGWRSQKVWNTEIMEKNNFTTDFFF